MDYLENSTLTALTALVHADRNDHTIVAPHEVQFSGLGDIELNTYVYYLLRIIAVFGIAGNSAVIMILLKQRKSKGGYMKALMINQSLADLLTATSLLTSTFVQVPNNFTDMSWSSELICRTIRTQLPLTIFFSISVYNLVTVTFTQYMIIVHPVFYHNRMKNMSGRVYVSAVWGVGIFFNVLLTLPVSGVVATGNGEDKNKANYTLDYYPTLFKNSTMYTCSEYEYNLSDTGKRITGIAGSTVYYFLPILCIVYSFWHILRRLHTKRNQIVPLGQSTAFRSVKLSVLRSMLLFCSVFISCWSMNSFIHILYMFNCLSESFHDETYYSVSVVIFYCCCAINPLLYVVRYRRFREAMHSAMSGCYCNCHKPIATVAVLELTRIGRLKH